MAASIIKLDSPFGIGGGVAVGIACGIASIVMLPRLYYYPLHLLLTWPKARPTLVQVSPSDCGMRCGCSPAKASTRLLVDKAMI
jgi:hypothetical protein